MFIPIEFYIVVPSMNMDEAYIRKLAKLNIRGILTKWFSFTILRHSSREFIQFFRKIEKLLIKINKLKGHLSFNDTCLNNSLLPIYTNIYIYIYLLRTAMK